jgi:hypothetical protein
MGWPLDSPKSLGVSLCFLLVFLVGFGFSQNPAALGSRATSLASIEQDKRMGRVIAYIFGPLALAVLFGSWARSNDERYAWLQ